MPGACGSESRTSRGIGQRRRRHRVCSTGAAEPVAERAPRGDAVRLEQADEFLPDERRRFDVVGAAPQRANRATEVSSERAQAAARQIGQEAPGNVTRTDHVEREEAGGQRAQERLLESSEMDDRRRGLLRETCGLVAERAPGELPVDRGPHHVLGDARDPRNGRRNLLALWKRDQARMRVRDRVADLGPADFKEMPSRRGGRGLAVDHQHLHLRERLGMTAQHHSPQPNLIRDRASMPRTPLIEQLLQPSLLQCLVGASRDAIAPGRSCNTVSR